MGGVELGRALERVGQPAKEFADGWRPRRQRPLRRVTVEVAAAGYRALASDIERSERIHLSGIRNAHDHAELLLHARIRRRRFHAAIFQGWPLVLVEIRQNGGCGDGLPREAQPCLRAHGARCLGDRGTVFRYEHAGYSVEGPHALDVVPNDADAGRLSRANRLVQLIDRRLFKAKRRVGCAGLICHCVTFLRGALTPAFCGPVSEGSLQHDAICREGIQADPGP